MEEYRAQFVLKFADAVEENVPVFARIPKPFYVREISWGFECEAEIRWSVRVPRAALLFSGKSVKRIVYLD